MHTIRLRGPWQIEPVSRFLRDAQGELREDTDHLPAPMQVNVPGNWSAAWGAEFRGRASFLRRFGLPTNLEADEQVILVVGETVERALITLNGVELGHQHQADGERRYEVTPLLQLRNELIVLIAAVEVSGAIQGEVKLEITNRRST